MDSLGQWKDWSQWMEGKKVAVCCEKQATKVISPILFVLSQLNDRFHQGDRVNNRFQVAD